METIEIITIKEFAGGMPQLMKLRGVLLAGRNRPLKCFLSLHFLSSFLRQHLLGQDKQTSFSRTRGYFKTNVGRSILHVTLFSIPHLTPSQFAISVG